ncbi:formate/nitrite transporter family protein [Neobacillus drentensis]|uniref:formate/nitrite transporter family protein n=1 Tax=Neobacillus drentensis TaxID=220684 RepID=UPI001F37D5EF|nr:formate/nitrite transporter family protein [Neobacillus drentensis]ULT59361.1 formate/nitrite transporter family protein [Neobacillus drentensis]
MAFHSSKRIVELAVEAGAKKASMRLGHTLLLGFLGGAFIAFGFLLDIRVTANLPEEWGSFSSLIGAAVFPIGLILIVIAGGELVTGNMMALPIAVLAKRATIVQLMKNWLLLLISNFIGAIFVAYFFGHIVGLTETGPFLNKTVAIAEEKIHQTFIQSFISAVGCNWLVCLAVWMAFGSNDIVGKMCAIWLPIMGFVAIGFQQVVANMFVIPAAIFSGHFTWGNYFINFVPVLMGNSIGGAVFVAFIYWIIHKESFQTLAIAKPSIKKAS